MIKGLLARKDSCPMLVGGVNSAAPTDGLSQSLNNQPPTPGLDRTLPGTPMLPLTLRSTDVVLVRHGETAWSRSGQHTGSTDIPLTPAGELAARALAPFLEQLTFARVFCSPLARARRTAELAGFGTRLELDADLMEWNYGAYEGRTSAEIQATTPGWLVFRDGCPDGESPEAVGSGDRSAAAGPGAFAGGGPWPSAAGVGGPLAGSASPGRLPFSARHNYGQRPQRLQRHAGVGVLERTIELIGRVFSPPCRYRPHQKKEGLRPPEMV
jgi:hypothetical protein